MSERVAALIDEPLDAYDVQLCNMAETLDELGAKMFCQVGAWAEGTWAGVVAARLRLQDINPVKYGEYDVLER